MNSYVYFLKHMHFSPEFCAWCSPFTGGSDFLVGTLLAGPSAASSPLPPEEPIIVDPTLTPDILSTQFERLLVLQQKLESHMENESAIPEYADLELEVAQLVDHLCRHHISELGSAWALH